MREARSGVKKPPPPMIMTDLGARRSSLARITCNTKDIMKKMKEDELNQQRKSIARHSTTPSIKSPAPRKSSISTPTISSKGAKSPSTMKLNATWTSSSSLPPCGRAGIEYAVRTGGFQVLDTIDTESN